MSRRSSVSVSGEEEEEEEDEAPPSPQERSNHRAFIHNNTMYVWGGNRTAHGEDVVLPSDEMWSCDLDSGKWELIKTIGDIPPEFALCSSANIESTFFIFGGWLDSGYTNQVYNIDTSEQPCTWRKVTNTKGMTPSPRNKHSCWVYKDRLIFFGGYGCKTIREVQNSPNFLVDEMSWATIGNMLFQCFGWNNEVVVFDVQTSTWSVPQTTGLPPAARGCHASAQNGSKAYISGGVETTELDLFCLDLDTWTWTQFDSYCSPLGRCMHTMTSISDHKLFVYGGLGVDGSTLNDAWTFDTTKSEWTKLKHQHVDKARVSHSACLGSDGDVVVFGGCSKLLILMDTVSILRAPTQDHCSDVLIFQTQPYSLSRLCEDSIGGNSHMFGDQLLSLPSKLQSRVRKRIHFFSSITFPPTP
ncbi:kelch domain-containing protein 1-like [Gouania willdenowi]|uniref:Kelch domain-containing protein 1-like n=1 Tax=Gouania willdenowi TaxID=441366 RepID=A0A8C5N6U1_GOUWI|nr:kelch domain-containing protein 1-like [Gouania willdenowi]